MIDPKVEERPEGRTLVIPWKGMMDRSGPVCLALLTPMVAITGFCAYEGWGFTGLFLAFAACWLALLHITLQRGNSTSLSVLRDGSGLDVRHGPFPSLQPSGFVPCAPSSRVFLRPRADGLLAGMWAASGNEALQDLCVGDDEPSGRPVFSGLTKAEGAALARHLKLFLAPEEMKP